MPGSECPMSSVSRMRANGEHEASGKPEMIAVTGYKQLKKMQCDVFKVLFGFSTKGSAVWINVTWRGRACRLVT